MSLARPSMAPRQHDESRSFFELEKERLINDIAGNFEELMGAMNTYNRTLEDIHGVGKEFGSVAQLWGRFNELIRKQQTELAEADDVGVPGTGGANFGASLAQSRRA